MLMNPPAPARRGTKFAHVQIALLVRLGKTEERGIKAAAVVVVELVGLIDNGLRVDRSAEVEAACRHAANDSRLGRQRHQVRDFFLIGDARNAFGHADAQIDDAVGIKLQRRAPRDDLSFVHLHRRDRSRACPNFAAERRVILNRECLPMVFGLGHDDTVDKDAGYFDLPRVERAALSYSLHLHNDKASGILHRHGDRQHFEGERFFFHRDVAIGIGRGAANDADIDRKCAIEKKFFAIDLD